MTRKFDLVFVDNIPTCLEEGKLYVSMKYHTTAHLCACGCGERVINPLNWKYGWVITYDGQRLSLSPSIGNYQFPCHSHYLIKNNEVFFLGSDDYEIHGKNWAQKMIVRIKNSIKKKNDCLKHAITKGTPLKDGK